MYNPRPGFDMVGTDVSLEECWEAGYTVMEYSQQDLVGETSLPATSQVVFYANGKKSTWYLLDLWETYEENGEDRKSIEECCDMVFEKMPENLWEWLHLGDCMRTVGWTFDRDENFWGG